MNIIALVTARFQETVQKPNRQEEQLQSLEKSKISRTEKIIADLEGVQKVNESRGNLQNTKFSFEWRCALFRLVYFNPHNRKQYQIEGSGTRQQKPSHNLVIDFLSISTVYIPDTNAAEEDEYTEGNVTSRAEKVGSIFMGFKTCTGHLYQESEPLRTAASVLTVSPKSAKPAEKRRKNQVHDDTMSEFEISIRRPEKLYRRRRDCIGRRTLFQILSTCLEIAIKSICGIQSR